MPKPVLNNTLTQDRLKELLHYDPKTGLFTRIKKLKNNRFGVGSIAGGKSSTGYIRISVDYKRYKAHRLAWLYMEGYWPENIIDHIDGNGFNNKWDNLREASDSCNAKNSQLRKDNTSSVKGVYKNQPLNEWVAYICVGGKQKYLGKRKKFKDAVYLRYSAEIKYKFYTCQTVSSAYNYLITNNMLGG